MIEVEQAQALLRQQLKPQTVIEQVPLLQALGRVLAKEVRAPLSVPDFPRSGMDGYAVCFEDIKTASPTHPVTLPVAGVLYAGDDPTGITAQPQSAYRVMTGAAIPAGFDTVVKQELTDLGKNEVTFLGNQTKGANYSNIGEDIQADQVLLGAFTRLTSDSLGILASIGLAQVPVLKKIRVGLLATGNELALVGDDLKPGQIYNSTGYTLAAYIQQFSGEVVFQKVCPDDPKVFRKLLAEYEGKVDLVITTGGVSVGEKDFIPQGLAEIGATELFHYVNLKPGTPVMAATWQDSVILSLSGNPFAAFVNFQLFYWDLLAHFMNTSTFQLKQKKGVITTGSMPAQKIRRFVRGNYQDGKIAIPSKGHRSGVFHTVVENNCLIEQPLGKTLQVGDQVTTYLWPDPF